MVRIASFNVENLFERPKAFNKANWSIGKSALDAYREVSALFSIPVYSAEDKNRIFDLLVALDIYSVNDHGAIRRKLTQSQPWACLRKNRVKSGREAENQSESIKIAANARDDWIGWIALPKEPTIETSIRMMTRAIKDVGDDIIGIIEAVDRPPLVRFNKEMVGGL